MAQTQTFNLTLLLCVSLWLAGWLTRTTQLAWPTLNSATRSSLVSVEVHCLRTTVARSEPSANFLSLDGRIQGGERRSLVLVGWDERHATQQSSPQQANKPTSQQLVGRESLQVSNKNRAATTWEGKLEGCRWPYLKEKHDQQHLNKGSRVRVRVRVRARVGESNRKGGGQCTRFLV